LAAAAAVGLENPFFRTHDRIGHGCATIDGRETINYTSFDYLGLAGHPEVVAAAKAAIDQLGCSASASRLVGGNHSILEELDKELARFLGTEAAIVFPSGYGTNASVLGHLFGENDLILFDELAHNSMVQGATLSKAGRRSFPHNDADALDELLRDIRSRYRRVAVAMEGVYSMDGDYPDLPKFLEVKHRHRALLYVDEAHALGTMGRTGRGTCEHFGVEPTEGDIWMGTISKALGSGGGYLAGREPLVRYLKYTTPSFVFATACSPPNAAAALTALRVLQKEPERVARLRDRAAQFLKLARECGLNTGNSHDTPIVPIILGNSAQCIRVSQELLRQGINAQPILYPAVRESAARVRFFISAEHTEEQIARTVEVLAQCIAATADKPG
jgi:8-amino-7-oxononanoate synthase